MSDYYRDTRVAEAYERDMGTLSDTVDDIPFYVGLAQEAARAGQKVLELACGTGRVTIPIAQAGVHVVGLDSSSAMLDIARRKSAELPNVSWVEGDMRSFDFGESFGLAIIPFRSFLHLLKEDDQLSCLSCVQAHLAPEGRLALNFFVPDPRLLEFAHSQLDNRSFISRVERRMQLRHVTREEMEHLLALSSFEVEALYGWFDGRPFDDQSNEMVWVARKRDA